MPNEQEQFLKDLKNDGQEQDPFAYLNDKPAEPVVEEKPADDKPATEIQPKNRREIRLMEKLQAEREAGIQLAAKLAALEEARNAKPDTSQNEIELIYGVDTPEAREASEILKNEILRAKQEAVQEALRAIEERENQANAAVKEAEEQLEGMIDDIEDTFNVDLTSPEADELRTNFYKLLERVSPKDRDGNILYYADHFAVWEDLQARLQTKADNTAKTLSSRSMTTGTPGASSNLANESLERALRENGII